MNNHIYPIHTIETNPYQNLYVDLTERCNMTCHFCFNPDRINTNMDVSMFERVCSQSPHQINWRLLGGEPTLHPRFFDIIDIAIRYNHTVYFSSNGIKLTDPVFVQELSNWSGKLVVGLSMDGGTQTDEFYESINDRPMLAVKMKAIDMLQAHNIRRVCLSAIIVRGMNEHVIKELWDLSNTHDVIRYIHYRTAAKVGRWLNIDSYDLSDLKRLMGDVFTNEQMQPKCIGEINCNNGDGECCYRFRPSPRMQISLIEFASERSAHCPNRGKLNWDTTIEPFFANMRNTRS